MDNSCPFAFLKMPSTRSKLGAKSSHNTIYIQLQLVACDNNVKEKVNKCSKIFHQDYFLPFRKSGTCTTFSECMIVNRSTYIDQLIRSKGNGLITLV